MTFAGAHGERVDAARGYVPQAEGPFCHGHVVDLLLQGNDVTDCAGGVGVRHDGVVIVVDRLAIEAGRNACHGVCQIEQILDCLRNLPGALPHCRIAIGELAGLRLQFSQMFSEGIVDRALL